MAVAIMVDILYLFQCVFERNGFRLEKAHLEQAVQLQKVQQENKKLDLYAPFF